MYTDVSTILNKTTATAKLYTIIQSKRNTTDKQGIHDCIRSFTYTNVKVANPLFCKTVSYTYKLFVVNSLSKKSEWFDEDCCVAKTLTQML